jgi:hypothetical protein
VFPGGQQASQPRSDDHVVPDGQQPPGAHRSGPPGQHVVSIVPLLLIETQHASPDEKRQHGSSAQSPVPQQAWPEVVGHQPSLVQTAAPWGWQTPPQHSSPNPQHVAPHAARPSGQSSDPQVPLMHGSPDSQAVLQSPQ